MVLTYNGRVESGHFYPVDDVMVPDCRTATLVLGTVSHNISHHQAEAMRRFREGIRKCDEPVPEFERVRFSKIDI